MLLCVGRMALPRTLRTHVRGFQVMTPSCGWGLFAPPTAQCHGGPPSLRLAPILQPPAYRLSLQRGLHMSSQQQKRIRDTEESLLKKQVCSHWQEIKKTPRPAFILALAGATPFVTSPLLLTFFYHPELPMLQVLHGACVLSFLGGVRWGYTLPDSSPAMLSWGNLLSGALFPYIALVALLIREEMETAMMALGIGLGISLTIDIVGIRDLDVAPISPLWYRWLRGVLTVIAIASFIATGLILNQHPEKSSTNHIKPKEKPRTSQ